MLLQQSDEQVKNFYDALREMLDFNWIPTEAKTQIEFLLLWLESKNESLGKSKFSGFDLEFPSGAAELNNSLEKVVIPDKAVGAPCQLDFITVAILRVAYILGVSGSANDRAHDSAKRYLVNAQDYLTTAMRYLRNEYNSRTRLEAALKEGEIFSHRQQENRSLGENYQRLQCLISSAVKIATVELPQETPCQNANAVSTTAETSTRQQMNPMPQPPARNCNVM